MGLLIPIVLLGLMSSLSPSTIVVFILLLATTRARVNAVAFLVGWAFSLTLVFYLSYAFGESHTLREGNGRTGIELLKVGLGVVMIVAGMRRWARRNEPSLSSGLSPALTGRLRDLTPRSAVVVGILKQPWAITAAAAVVVLSHHTAPIVTIIAFVAFTIVSTATVAAIFYYYTHQPEEAALRLNELSVSVTRRTPEVFAAVAVAVGLILIVDGLRALLI